MQFYNIADLNKRITIQKAVKTPDAMGGYTESWSDVIEVWAAVWPQSAREVMKEITRDSQTVGEITHRVRIRWRRGITTRNRVKYKNRYFNILLVITPNEDNEWIDMLCKEVV